jgi:hypothetical protein
VGKGTAQYPAGSSAAEGSSAFSGLKQTRQTAGNPLKKMQRGDQIQSLDPDLGKGREGDDQEGQ